MTPAVFPGAAQAGRQLAPGWDGEWRVTCEVFRDLGAAFSAVLIIIHILRRDLPYKIEGKVSVSTSFGSRRFAFSKDGRID
ncbi:MAG: hypothetical protein HPY65_02000 [Syntrophaceae bacterium]|nr:hypothetical protein [Syntrophaceae bacterium]